MEYVPLVKRNGTVATMAKGGKELRVSLPSVGSCIICGCRVGGGHWGGWQRRGAFLARGVTFRRPRRIQAGEVSPGLAKQRIENCLVCE